MLFEAVWTGLNAVSLCFHFSRGLKGQFLTSPQLIILNFLEHQRKLEKENLNIQVTDSTERESRALVQMEAFCLLRVLQVGESL